MKMIHITEQKINELVQKTLAKIKSADNPYENLKFVNEIFKDSPSNVKHSIKNLIKRQFKGVLNKNLFESVSKDLTPAQHLYNFLYEHNLLSKYDQVAEYMNYPTITQLNEQPFYSGEPDEQDLIKIMNLPKDKIKGKTIILTDDEFANLSIIKLGALKSLKRDYDYDVEKVGSDIQKKNSMREKLLAARERQGKPPIDENDNFGYDPIEMSYEESTEIEITAQQIIEDLAVDNKGITKDRFRYRKYGWILIKDESKPKDMDDKTILSFNVYDLDEEADNNTAIGKINLIVNKDTQNIVGANFDIHGVKDEVVFYNDDETEAPF